MTDKKTERLFIRVTPEFKERLDEVVATVPGGRADVMRWALERYVAELERNNNGGARRRETAAHDHDPISIEM